MAGRDAGREAPAPPGQSLIPRLAMTTQSPSTELFAPASAQPHQSESEADSALFVIWGNGRHAADRILADLRDRFTLLNLYEVSWSSGRVMENYRRFYSDLPVRGVYHSHAKGRAPFSTR